jgi:antitoxin ParD1/3/4
MLLSNAGVKNAVDKLRGPVMPTRNINLTDRYDEFVEEQVKSGRFRNASEVMRAGLHLLEQQACEEQEKLAILRALAAEAFEQLDQGEGVVLDGARELATHISRLGKRSAAAAKPRGR